MTELASPVQLSANDDNRGSGAEQPDLRHPLVAHVLVRGEGADTEAHEEHVRLGIGQRSVFRILLMKHRSHSHVTSACRTPPAPPCQTAPPGAPRLPP